MIKRGALNTLAVERRPTRFAGEQKVLLIDGSPLDEILDHRAPGHELVGLLPTLAGCADASETRIAEHRFLPAVGATALAPILMCPDDLDFTCTLVVAEVMSSLDYVEWQRIGLDSSKWHADPEMRIGQHVEWLVDVGPFRFTRADVEGAMAAFRW